MVVEVKMPGVQKVEFNCKYDTWQWILQTSWIICVQTASIWTNKIQKPWSFPRLWEEKHTQYISLITTPPLFPLSILLLELLSLFVAPAQFPNQSLPLSAFQPGRLLTEPWLPAAGSPAELHLSISLQSPCTWLLLLLQQCCRDDAVAMIQTPQGGCSSNAPSKLAPRTDGPHAHLLLCYWAMLFF